MEKKYLEPGVYSAFVLSDDGMWEQPSFRLTRPSGEHAVESALCDKYGGFFVAGLQEDTDAPEDCVTDLEVE